MTRKISFLFWPLLLVLMAGISTIHLLSLFALPPFWLGLGGWVALLGWGHHELAQNRDRLWGWMIFLLFVLLGLWTGPYLEPPVDPLEHLRRAHLLCHGNSTRLETLNYGLWHYSMVSDFICWVGPGESPEIKLRLIDLAHGFFWGLLAMGIVILARNAKLPRRWALISLIIAFFYFGTNRFSYFSYYSLAPSSSSLLLVWLWAARFFFKDTLREGLKGFGVALLLIPVLLVNHVQEAVFLILVVLLWWVVFSIQMLWLRLNRRGHLIFTLGLLIFGWGVPQLGGVQNFFLELYPQQHLAENAPNLFRLGGKYLIGPNWQVRIADSLGIMGFLPLFLAPWFLYPAWVFGSRPVGKKIWLLSVLPFLIYLIPLLNLVWAILVRFDVYWRLCYITIYWVGIAYFGYGLEAWARLGWWRWKPALFSFSWHTGRLLGVLLLAMILIKAAGVRSAPLYGKRDFIQLPSRPWWPAWKPLLEGLRHHGKVPIQTDPTTSAVLGGVFDYPVFRFRELSRSFAYTDFQWSELAKQCNCLCLINRAGFTPSWVPVETGHWSAGVADTASYYILKNRPNPSSPQYIAPSYCLVFPGSEVFQKGIKP